MSNIRRYNPHNHPVFITCVTNNRKPILLDMKRQILASYRHIERLGVSLIAWTLMPDHLHAIIEINNISLSQAVHRFKRKLNALCYHTEYRGLIWQKRYWDHIIRDQNDFNRHIDYIHFNPVKHNLVDSPIDWQVSSLHKWISNGYYIKDWRSVDQMKGKLFGE